MNISFRKIEEKDRSKLLSMMRIFYDSPAVFVKSSDKVLNKDIDDCIDSNFNLLDGYVIVDSDNIVGYFMVSLCYTTEYGGLVLYIEDIFIDANYRGMGICAKVFEFLKSNYPNVIRFKLEVEKENENAIRAYNKAGFNMSPYFEMTKELL